MGKHSQSRYILRPCDKGNSGRMVFLRQNYSDHVRRDKAAAGFSEPRGRQNRSVITPMHMCTCVDRRWLTRLPVDDYNEMDSLAPHQGPTTNNGSDDRDDIERGLTHTVTDTTDREGHAMVHVHEEASPNAAAESGNALPTNLNNDGSPGGLAIVDSLRSESSQGRLIAPAGNAVQSQTGDVVAEQM